MVRYEQKVISAYQEKQALKDSSFTKNEQAAFDSVISAYTVRVLEIYETLNRINGFTLESYRQSAARTLIFRALAFLESADTIPEMRTRACEDYRHALQLTRDSKVPIFSQQLPYEVWIGDRLYSRLTDLLDDKDRNLILLQCMQNSTENRKAKK